MALDPNTLKPGLWSTHRNKVDAGGVSPDGAASTLTPGDEALLNCKGYETILVYPELTGGAAPTVDIEPLLMDGTRFVAHATTGALSDGEVVELEVREQRVLLRLNAVVNAPTGVLLRVAGGKHSRARMD